MTASQRYEIIRPIIGEEKTVKEIHSETDIPLKTLYRWLKRFNEGNREISSLADRPSKPHRHPLWLTPQQRNLVVQYKLHYPQMSSRQIAKELSNIGLLEVSSKTVSNILNQHNLQYNVTTSPFFLTVNRVKPLWLFHLHRIFQIHKCQQMTQSNSLHCRTFAVMMGFNPFSRNGLMIFHCY